MLTRILQGLYVDSNPHLRTTLALCVLGLLLSAACIIFGGDVMLTSMPTD